MDGQLKILYIWEIPTILTETKIREVNMQLPLSNVRPNELFVHISVPIQHNCVAASVSHRLSSISGSPAGQDAQSCQPWVPIYKRRTERISLYFHLPSTAGESCNFLSQGNKFYSFGTMSIVCPIRIDSTWLSTVLRIGGGGCLINS